MGRRSKLTPETQQKIVEGIRLGGYMEIAARSAGVAPTTFYRWMAEGERASSGPKKEFREAVKTAEAARETYWTGLIQRAAGQQWQAAAWLLERQYPARWAKRERLEVRRITVSELDAEIERLSEELERDGADLSDLPPRPE